ncbi:RagB/SusD family nutrient uptake outer membrane protein [Dysgonomonas massiliensis]|uniref:RagB/SusD family nutrient uptake outer membrane protein n=1 Tax=Dysgonomonas massiliensis TaxID=2040292 RepID=UPI000C77B2B4|nr:RagB/SusD family nutrient uptake outer membrane protein [Dysgonomonas massiliensis]
MKNIRIIIGAALFAMLTFSCSDNLLDEKPRGTADPDFFKTEEGVRGGLTSLYAHTRWIFGQYFYAAAQNGTDESTYAQSADNNFKDTDMSGAGSLTPSTSRSDALWGAAFSNINTASGIIENAAAVGLSEAMIAEARFFRAWDYFMLVQTFGGVPLDLGSGELKFNSSTSRTSVRNTVPEVYTKAIFPDMIAAVQHLPEKGRVTGGLTKTAARLFLSKAYLTYAWWLENPNSIPTYPETPRVDPDGHDAAWYYQEAYNVALEGIKNPAGFALQPTFYDVHLGSNDRNSEIVLYSDHIEDEYYNQASLSWSNGGAPESFAVWFATWNYTDIRSSVDGENYGTSSVQREAVQWGGRPWTRMCPTIDVITETFADKKNDSRYDGTFVTVYRGNWEKAGVANEVLYNANGLPIKNGDPILTFLDEEPETAITYPTGSGQSNIGAGTLPDRADWVIAPSGISRVVYPGLWKLGTYRTDNGSGLGQPNGAITRPWNIAKFSEFYFIAAEAAVKGAKGEMDARELINVIRARAGKWRWHNNNNVEMIVDNSAAMIEATPAVDKIDIEYILAERSREYYGEGYRWYDLVRTQSWADIAGSYTICGSSKGDHDPKVTNRTILPYHYLRPIPQSQLDRMTMSEAEKKAYQNPNY